MNEQLPFPARTTDPDTSHQAARQVTRSNPELVKAIRKALMDFGPLTAWEIADHVIERHGTRWASDSIRTACARSGLGRYELDGASPRGNRCMVYCLDRETVEVRGERL